MTYNINAFHRRHGDGTTQRQGRLIAVLRGILA
jgi:hypothetical protein